MVEKCVAANQSAQKKYSKMLLAKFCLYDWALVLVDLNVFSIEMLHMDLFGQVREREREDECIRERQCQYDQMLEQKVAQMFPKVALTVAAAVFT